MKSLLMIVTAITLAVAGCSKEESKPEPKDTPAAETQKPTPTEEPAKPDVDPNADYVRVLAGHMVPKKTDPVIVSITRFGVVKADFDPAKVEGGTATIELDVTSLESGSAKRDKHLRSDDYLDVEKFAKVTVAIDNVKKTGDNAYAADATVKVRETEKKFPVTFTVLETLPDGIRVKGEHTFSRHDLAIGHPEGEEDSAGRDLTIQMQLTLKKT
jgi:polyisoprenoid-binding protein YceI